MRGCLSDGETSYQHFVEGSGGRSCRRIRKVEVDILRDGRG